MTKLRELEERLRDEPDNLGLRVMVAGALHEAGRCNDAVELYRSVAIAYRDQGRLQQAITVCRSILELAPDNASCQELLAALLAGAPRASPPPAPRDRPSPSPAPVRPSPFPVRPSPLPVRPSPSPMPVRSSPAPVPPSSPWLPRPPTPDPETSHVAEPVRRSSGDVTPLPLPLPYHEADPTTGSLARMSRSDLPQSVRDELSSYPEIAGIAAAARQISASLIAAARREQETEELDDDDLIADIDTGKLPRGRASRSTPSASVPPPLPRPPTPLPEAVAGAEDDEPTLPPPLARAVPRAGALDDEKTEPREAPLRPRPPSIAPATAATGPLAGAFFAPLPPRNRAAVLQRFRRRMATAGTTVIRLGESGHGLVVVVRGRLEVHVERADGVRVSLGGIAAGEFIGEASLLARTPATVQVLAETDAELLVLAREDFYDVTSAFPELRAELESVAELRAHAQQGRLQG